MRYVDYVYKIVATECSGLDSVYRDYIIELVGVFGLNALIAENLVETCGYINGRQLYVLYVKKEY